MTRISGESKSTRKRASRQPQAEGIHDETMVACRALCVALALSAVDAKKKKKGAARTKYAEKYDPTAVAEDPNAAEENEYTKLCSECFKMAQHASRALKFNIEHGQEPARDAWQNVLKAGCGYEDKNLCNRVLLPKYGAQIADELAEIYEAAEGDHTDSAADFSPLSAALCGHDSITGACPKGFHAHPKPPKPEAGSWESRGEDFKDKAQLSFWNDCSLGAIELHLIDRNVVSHDACVDSETDGDRACEPRPSVVATFLHASSSRRRYGPRAHRPAGRGQARDALQVRPGPRRQLHGHRQPDRQHAVRGPGQTRARALRRRLRRHRRLWRAPRRLQGHEQPGVQRLPASSARRVRFAPPAGLLIRGPRAGNETNVPLVATRMGASEEVGKQAAAKDILLPESDGEL